MAFPRRDLPRMARVRQDLPGDRVPDIARDVKTRLLASGLVQGIAPGHRIAITAGSRGIGGLVELLKGIVQAVNDRGATAFVVPAMGSHGGATANGQAEILRRLGVTDRTIGAPIHATMETVDLGASESGAVAHLDKLAFESDGIIVLGRVKTHPESVGTLASGLLKMCTIGLGKQAGAQQAHGHGLWPSVVAVPKLQLASGKILCGVAVVENGYRQPCAIEVVPPTHEAFLAVDVRLLRLAKAHFARIPFDDLDLLVVDELGKTISGGGMDPNIIGLWRNSDAPHHPDYRRIVVLSLTEASLGNGLGIGMADFTTRRFADAYDPAVSYINLLTATEPNGNTREGPLPLTLDSDREAIEVGLFSSHAGPSPRVCRIKNTAMLDEFWVSEALVDEVEASSTLHLFAPPSAWPFDDRGNLL
ncbi:MAG TPA: DUF362 domain-containing protein [Vicinamibacterales bacterium]|nr:DUF362 domain-containing protein [Vicinamibacterales bacterium]